MSAYSLRSILLSLICIYTGYYFCRTDLSVALPSLISSTQISKSSFGLIISYGYFAYAVGKLLNGALVDKHGSKRVLIYCLLGSVLCTFFLSLLSDHPFPFILFGVLWFINRYFQSGGWPALITLVKALYPPHRHGNILGLASLSYSLGDALIRLVLGELLTLGFSWQAVFVVSALSALVLMVPAWWMIDNSLPHFANSHASPSAPSSSTSPSTSISGAVPNPTASPSSSFMTQNQKLQFLVLVIQAPIFVWSREVFQTWSPVFLHDTFGLSPGLAAHFTVLFPLLGAMASVLGGYLVDRTQRRGFYYTLLILGSALSLAVVPSLHALFPMLLALSFFFLLISAPMVWTDGVFPLMLAHGPYTGRYIGLLHGTGYLGAMLSGAPVGWLIERAGWPRLFAVMSGWMFLNGLLATAFWYLDAPHRTYVRVNSGEAADDLVDVASPKQEDRHES